MYTYSLPPPPVKIDDARMMQIIAESKEKYGIKPSDIEDELESEGRHLEVLGGGEQSLHKDYRMRWSGR